MQLLFIFVVVLSSLLLNIKAQSSSISKTVSICADEYRLNSYPLQCQFGQGVNIIQVIEKFEKNNQRPDCYGKGSLDYNYSKPIVDFCNGKTECVLSSAFIDEKKLFDAETYFLPDNSYYLIPYRIDIVFDCSSNIVLTTTRPIFTEETTQTISTATIETTTASTTTTSTTTTNTTTITTTITTTTTTTTTDSTTLITPNTTEFFSITNMTIEVNNSTENISSKYSHFSSTTLAQHNLKHNSGAPFLSVNEDEYLTKKIKAFNHFTIAYRTKISLPASTSSIKKVNTSASISSSISTSLKFSTNIHQRLNENNLTTKMKFNILGKSVSSIDTSSTLSTQSSTTRTRSIAQSTVKQTKINPKIIYSNINDLKNKFKSFKDPTTTTSTTTKVAAYEPNSDTDRTVMIVLIVLGSVFFLIIVAIAILICIRRQNQAKLDREFGYKNDYSGDDSSSHEANISTIGGSIRQKHISGPFSEISGIHSSRNMESLTGTFGTYRSRSNNGYDHSDESTNESSRVGDRRPRVDDNEYWRTNV